MDHAHHMIHPEAAHVMAGIPTWMAVGAVALVIAASHFVVRGDSCRVDAQQRGRFNLFRFTALKSLITRPFFPILLQFFSILLLVLIIWAGLFGSQRQNIATVLTWTWWWALLIFIIVVFGKGFCSFCPWEGLASLATSLSLRSRIKKIGFELKWPRWARNLYPALGLFILLTWFELGYEATRSPSLTAIMGLSMTAMAVLGAMIFEGRAFCRYACLVGRVSGIYALFSPVELRPQSTSVCRSCHTVDCVKGNDQATGCPTHLFPGNLQQSTYCTLCTECIRACPHDNLSINLRPPAADLLSTNRFRWDEAVLALVLLALTSFHGMTMTSHWERVNDWLRVVTGFGPLVIFTFLMALLIILPVLVFWGSAALSRLLLDDGSITRSQILKAFAYAVIPVALFYHLAHNGMHFFREAQQIGPLLSDPFGFGWDLFGTSGKSYGALLSLQTVWWIQVVLILIGHVYAVVVLGRIGRALFSRSPGRIMITLAPFVVTMIGYSSLSIWLIAQPMVMRSGM